MIVFFLYNSTCFYGLACVSAKHVSFLVDISLGGDGGEGGDGGDDGDGDDGGLPVWLVLPQGAS